MVSLEKREWGKWERQTHLCGVALALERASQVVNDDAGAARSKEGGICLAEAAASPGDDDNLSVVPQLCSHGDVCAVDGRSKRESMEEVLR